MAGSLRSITFNHGRVITNVRRSKTEAKLIKGECNCGAVSFETSSSVEQVFICHCSICRRSTGGAGIAVTIVEKDSFNWLSGKALINTWHKPNHDWQTSFCTVCGSSLPGKNDKERIYIPVSLLNCGTENLKVAHHLYVGSKAAWEVIGDEGKQHLGAYGRASDPPGSP